MKLYLIILASITLLSSCFYSDESREQGKIFHAGPSTGGIGAMYFALFNDHTYQLCNSGGIGQDCYTGNFELHRDTLTLTNLDKKIPLHSGRFIIKRYAEQDSSYWNWKYAKNIGISTWQDFRSEDLIMEGIGDVYQLNDSNQLMKDDIYFIIRLDSLKNFL
ncbi:hypothetical protein [Ferruginibacter sp.]